MRGLNLVVVIGNVGRDPEVKHTESGKVVGKFSVAVSETWRGKDGEQKEETQWVPVACFGHLAETVEKFVTKGQLVVVVGKYKVRKYEYEGQTKYSTEVVADRIQFGSGKKKDDEQNHEDRDGYPESDEVPF